MRIFKSDHSCDFSKQVLPVLKQMVFGGLMTGIILLSSCKKEESTDQQVANLTGKAWTLAKTVTTQYINNVLDTIITNEQITQTEIYRFDAHGEVTLKSNVLAAPGTMNGSWWFADGETVLSTDLILQSSAFPSYKWLVNASIVTLSSSQLVLRMPETTYQMYVQNTIRSYRIVTDKYFVGS